MPKKPEKVTLDHNFAFTTDADLAAQISAFKAEHEAAQRQILAMDSKRSLGPGKVRVTFRVIEKPRSKGR
jgi:hypothetical protein